MKWKIPKGGKEGLQSSWKLSQTQLICINALSCFGIVINSRFLKRSLSLHTVSQSAPCAMALTWLAAWLQGHQQMDGKLSEDRHKAAVALLDKYMMCSLDKYL